MRGMEIIPERGVALVQLGQQRADVETRTGPPVHGPGRRRAVYRTVPSLVIHYHPDDTVELVELGHSGRGPETEVWFDGVQLTRRFLDEVVADLHAKGYTSTESDIGHEFHAGFAVWSMGSLSAIDLEQDGQPGAAHDAEPDGHEADGHDADEDDDENDDENEGDEDDYRPVAEGVSVAPYTYFTGP